MTDMDSLTQKLISNQRNMQIHSVSLSIQPPSHHAIWNRLIRNLLSTSLPGLPAFKIIVTGYALQMEDKTIWGWGAGVCSANSAKIYIKQHEIIFLCLHCRGQSIGYLFS